MARGWLPKAGDPGLEHGEPAHKVCHSAQWYGICDMSFGFANAVSRAHRHMGTGPPEWPANATGEQRSREVEHLNLMSLQQLLADFAKALARATDAPDDYPSWSGATYEQNMAELWALWRQIRPQLSDERQAELVEQTLLQMRHAFNSGDKAGGRDAVWSLRFLCVRGLR